jgi:hypothetical protein
LLAACDSGASVEADALIGLSDALHAFVQQRWPDAIWHREGTARSRPCRRAGAAQVDDARRVSSGRSPLLRTSAQAQSLDGNGARRMFLGRAFPADEVTRMTTSGRVLGPPR